MGEESRERPGYLVWSPRVNGMTIAGVENRGGEWGTQSRLQDLIRLDCLYIPGIINVAFRRL
jgi:hypothetical protein